MAQTSAQATSLVTSKAVVAPVTVFQGANSVVGAGMSTAVGGEITTVNAKSEVRYQVCLDTETLSHTLQIDQSANAGFGSFGVNEKTSFMQSTEQTTFSLNLVIYARHCTGSQVGHEFALKPGVVAPKTQSEMLTFFKKYGDSFVSSMNSGSEYYAVYTFYSQTREEQTAVKASLEANGIASGGTFGASLQTSVNNVVKTTSVRVSLQQMITGIANPTFPSADNLVSYALSFPSIPVDAPAILSCTAQGYETLAEFSSFEPIASNRAHFLGTGSQTGLYSQMLKTTDLRNQLVWLKGIYDTYGGYADKLVSDTMAQADSELANIDEQVTRFGTDPLGTFANVPPNSLSHGTPVLQYTSQWNQQQGGGGGSAFDDVGDTSRFIQNGTRISQIEMRTGEEVDGLTTTYVTKSGTTTTCRHGGNGGSVRTPLKFLVGERVNIVSGRAGKRVDHLDITTNQNHTIGGGGSGGGGFTWTVPAGCFVLGFRGRSGERMDQIQVVYAQFLPAGWVK